MKNTEILSEHLVIYVFSVTQDSKDQYWNLTRTVTRAIHTFESSAYNHPVDNLPNIFSNS